uniref:Uncharacterized protein n=1 Tax=Dechloromonas aromatica (strain RCB) TaxID=159087 RepID=Q47EZ2_DECAR
MRPSSLALGMLAVLVTACLLIFGLVSRLSVEDEQKLNANRALVEKLGLTDLALFTEARYTRHPTQADLHSALQDHPAAFDHFPSGSLLPPPALLTQSHAHLAGKTTSPD